MPSINWYGRKVFLLLLSTTLLVIPIALLPTPTLNPAINSKELVAKCLVAIVLAAAPLAVAFVRGGVAWVPRVAICLYVFITLLAAIVSNRTAYSLAESWHLSAFAALAVLFSMVPMAYRDLHKILLVIIAAGVLAAIYGMSVYVGFDFLSGVYRFKVGEDDARNYIVSFLGNAEYYGGYMAPLAVLCFSRAFRQSRSMRARIAWMLLTLVFLANLVLSGTRAAIMGFFIGAGLITLVEFRRLSRELRSRVLRLFAAIAILGAVGLLVFSTDNPVNHRNFRLAQRFTQVFDLNSASVRERIFFYSASSRIIAGSPWLGTGPGTFRINFFPAIEQLNREDERAGVMLMTADLQNRIAEHAHNDYLEIWCDSGTLGVAAIFFVVVSLIIRYFRLKPIDPTALARETLITAELRVARAGFFGAAMCLFANAIFSFPLHLSVRASLVWVLVGCFLAADEEYHRHLNASTAPVN